MNRTFIEVPLQLAIDSHVSSSKEMIATAAELSDPARAVVLGCGRCTEIPMDTLARTFHQTDYVDLDATSLRIAQARHSAHTARHHSRFINADLSGLISRCSRAAEEVSSRAATLDSCLDNISRLISFATPDFWRPASKERYDCIVCSAVLTQLQATVRNAIERVVLWRYPGSIGVLRSHEPWRRSLWGFACRIEDDFVNHLDSLLAPNGVVYLSDTVDVSWLRLGISQSFITEGTWIATRTGRITDYLHPRHQVIAQSSWSWLRQTKEGGYVGRLYGVQAVIYRLRKSS